MKDKMDRKTLDLLGSKRPVGRPPKHVSDAEKKAAAAEASRLYRERVRAEKAARKTAARPTSKVLDLSALPYSKRP